MVMLVGIRFYSPQQSTIRNQVRKGDSVIRWGGEEFLIALPGCSIKEAAKIAQNILLSVRGGNQCTASIGVASLLPGNQWEDAVNLANNRMRIAKERGRDCVVIPMHRVMQFFENENTLNGYCVVNADGRFVRVNSRCCEVLGYSEEQLLNLNFQAITHPQDLNPDVNSYLRVMDPDDSLTHYTMEKAIYPWSD